MFLSFFIEINCLIEIWAIISNVKPEDFPIAFQMLDSFNANLEKGIIEVAPLAYMRGRTLDNAYIILDEAQNTTPQQMKMFLTRLGFGSKYGAMAERERQPKNL